MAPSYPSRTTQAALTVDDLFNPPDAQGDDEADGIPGAARPVGYRGGHHGGQGQHDDGTVKHLSGRFQERMGGRSSSAAGVTNHV